MTRNSSKKVIFGDHSLIKYTSLVEQLQKEKVLCESYSDPNAFIDHLSKENYDVCVMNLLLGGIGPYEMIKLVRERSFNSDIKVIVVSRQVHKDNIHNSIKAGAHDFVGEPFDRENFYQRVVYHLAPKKVIEPKGYEGPVLTSESVEWVTLLLEATELLAKTEKSQSHAAFYSILSSISKKLKSNRTNLIVVEPELNSGVVLATSDDPNFHDYPISLNRYPEIQHVLHTGNLVMIENIEENALTKQVKSSVKSIQIGSMIVFPVRYQNKITGVLTIRRESHEQPPDQILRVLQALANTMAAHSNIKVLLRKMYRSMQ